MDINTQATIPVTELGNFSKLSNIIKEFGKAIVIQEDKPIYIINPITVDDTSEYISDEEFYAYANKFLKKNAEVYKQLAK
ncbi:hypothetical protein [Anaerobutyricum hallii]|uniref:hypothetical protein n=1 Tax=Anaerobutyricum hallii TaxID=39488 RepID=UPI0026EFBDEA|nr:hypothetical protein [Anaerobutyricum hallii]